MSKLSIVIPVYNRCAFVDVMINSIKVQTFTDWELFLVDDGSDNETVSMMKEQVSSDPRIHLITRDRLPKGAQTCRNIGMKQSVGEYIMILDSDDYLQPFCFERRIEFIEKRKELDFAVFPYVSFRGSIHEGNYIMCGGVDSGKNDLGHFLMGSIPFVVWNNIYRRDALIKNSIEWDEKILSLQDADFNMQCIKAGLKYDYASKYGYVPDYYFRQSSGPGRISHKIMTIAHAESHLYFASKTLRGLTENWRRENHKYIRWCLYHKFLLLKDVERGKWINTLFSIAEENKCGSLVKCSITIYDFLVYKLHLPSRIVKNFVFMQYYYEFKVNAKRRKNIIKKLLDY